MPTKNGNGNENIAGALADISDRLTRLVQDEIELAKAEVSQKAMSLVRGTAALAAGAVFGIFAVVFLLLTLAWVFDGIFVSGAGSLWLGFLIVLVILLVLTAGAALFAWRAFSVGAPTPKMAIDEGKKIKNTVTTFGGDQFGKNGGSTARGQDYPSPSFAAVAAPAVAAGAVVEPESVSPVAPTRPAPEPVAEPVATEPVAAAEPLVAPEPGTPEAAAGDEPSFISVPEESATQEHSTVDPDPPTLIADQESGKKPDMSVGGEPSYEIEQVQDDDSTGPENH